MSTPRSIKRFDGSDGYVVDLSQSWKLFDNMQNMGTAILFNGAIFSAGNSGKRGNPRVNWIETDRGPFLLETEDDYENAIKIAKISIEKIKEVFAMDIIKRLGAPAPQKVSDISSDKQRIC